jgi:hypothetical protein
MAGRPESVAFCFDLMLLSLTPACLSLQTQLFLTFLQLRASRQSAETSDSSHQCKQRGIQLFLGCGCFFCLKLVTQTTNLQAVSIQRQRSHMLYTSMFAFIYYFTWDLKQLCDSSLLPCTQVKNLMIMWMQWYVNIKELGAAVNWEEHTTHIHKDTHTCARAACT